MLVGEGSRRSNLRVLYGILAQSALKDFESEQPQAEHRNAYLLNLIRLLEMYRYETLRQPSHRAVLDRRQSNRNEANREKLEAEAIEQALRTAHEAIYPNQSRAEVVERLKAIFYRVIRDQVGPESGEEIETAKRFLEALVAALRS
jgi:hypothetical protein